MGRMIAILGTFVFVLVVDARPSSAQQFRHYPWCLFSGGSQSGFESCGFDSFEQCLLTRSGEGGICYANPAYRAAVGQPRRTSRRRQH